MMNNPFFTASRARSSPDGVATFLQLERFIARDKINGQ
jgi:hypothetical protein